MLPHQSFLVLLPEVFDDVNQVCVNRVNRRQDHSLLQLRHCHFEIVLDVGLDKTKKPLNPKTKLPFRSRHQHVLRKTYLRFMGVELAESKF